MAKRILKHILKNWNEYEVWNHKAYTVTEDFTTVTTEATLWTSPYDTSYWYTNITIAENSWIKWKEWAIYSFVVNTEMVVASANRNVRIRIGSSWSRIPLMNGNGSILNWNNFLSKDQQRLFVYKTTYQSTGALHIIQDSVWTTHSTISVTLSANWWSNNEQTVSATGVTASNTVIVSPAPANIDDYATSKIYCSAQGSNSLTFSCTDTPTGDISVNVLIMN